MNAHVAHNSGAQEWYTPIRIIEAAREVLGEIEIDPASSDVANMMVRASSFYTVEDSGFDHDWKGRIWLNPPYGHPVCRRFCEKLLSHVNNSDITEAIILTNNATETAWGQALLGACNAVCFPSSRIKYLAPDGIKKSPLQGQMICYFGDKPFLFRRVFGEIGVVR